MKRNNDQETIAAKRQKLDTLQSMAAGQVLDKLNCKLTNFSDLLIGQIKASPAFKEIETMIAALKQSICTSDRRESYYYSKVHRCVQTFQWEHKKMLCDLVDCDPMLQVRTELARMASHELQREWSDIVQQSSTARLLHEVYDGNGVKELMYAHTLHGPIGWSIYDDLVPTMKQVVDAKDIVYGSFRFPVVDWSAYDEKELLLVAFFWASSDIYFFKFNLKLKEQDPEHYEQRKLKKYLRMGRGNFGFKEAMVILNGFNKSQNVLRQKVLDLLQSLCWSRFLSIPCIRECNKHRYCTVSYRKVQESKKNEIHAWRRVGEIMSIKVSFEEFPDFSLWARHREKPLSFYCDSMKHFDELQEWSAVKQKVLSCASSANSAWDKLNTKYQDMD